MLTLALALLPPAAVQDGPQIVRSRTVTLTIPLERDDRPTTAALYLSRDGGRTWTAAPDDRTRWGIENQRLVITFEAPQDGLYGFRYQVIDELGPFYDDTAPGQAPFKTILIDATPPSLEALSPGETFTNGRELRIDYLAADASGLEAVTVWLSPDGGRSWGRAEARPAQDDRGTYFEVPFPDDGVYRLMLHARDRAGHETPGPAEQFARFSPHAVIRVRTRPPRACIDGAPEVHTAEAAARLGVRFDPVYAGEVAEVLVWVSKAGREPWTAVAARTPAAEEPREVAFDLPAPGRYGVVVGFRDPAGLEWRRPGAKAQPDAWVVWVPGEAPPPVAGPAIRWIAPKPDEAFAAGRPVVLAWAGDETVADASVTLEFRQGEGPWVAIAQARPAGGVETWMVPGPADGTVELRVRGRTDEGAEVEPAVLGPFHVHAAVRSDVAAARHHGEQAVLALAREEWAAAAAALTLALRAWPDYPEALRSLGVLYLRLDRPAEAMPHLLRARAAMRGDPEAYLNVATALRRLGLLDEAWRELDDGLTIAVPSDRWLLARFEQELLDLGDAFAPTEPGKAATAWQAVLSLPPVHPLLHDAARVRLAALAPPAVPGSETR